MRTRRLNRWTVLTGIVAAAAVGACGGAPPSAAPASALPATALEACRSTAGGASWSLAVEIDHGDSAALAMTSGADIALCSTTRTTAGFASTDVGVGRHPITEQPRLTFSSSAGESGASPTTLVGRVPRSTTTVRLAFADRSDELASVANGIWLAWLIRPATPVRIEALDAAGRVLDRIEDRAGVQPTD